MGRTARIPLILGLLVALACGTEALAAPEADGVVRYELENGLKVRLRPVAGAEKVAIMVLYDIGEAHDPEGKSGLAHLVEHCYVTAAAGEADARTAEAMMARYPKAWNAQTGADYTLFAFVVPKALFPEELAEAASRMGDLRVTEEDLAREKPRMALELHNMYERIPALASANRARALALPAAPGARKGGVVEQIEGITLEEVTTRLADHYKPGTARLILAGAIDVEEAKALVQEHFGALPRGKALPAPRAPSAPSSDLQVDVELEKPLPGTPRYVCLARRAPSPAAASYPPFLLLAYRLFQSQARSRGGAPTITYGLLDAPDLLFVQAAVEDGEAPEERIARLQTGLVELAGMPLTPADRLQATQVFAHQLGTFTVPDHLLVHNLYGVALGIGRREQMGIDGKALAERMASVTDAELRLAGETLFDRANGVDVVAAPAEAKAPPR